MQIPRLSGAGTPFAVSALLSYGGPASAAQVRVVVAAAQVLLLLDMAACDVPLDNQREPW
jgi:hypothetical protein